MLYLLQCSLGPGKETKNKIGKKEERKIREMKGMKPNRHRDFVEYS